MTYRKMGKKDEKTGEYLRSMIIDDGDVDIEINNGINVANSILYGLLNAFKK